MNPTGISEHDRDLALKCSSIFDSQIAYDEKMHTKVFQSQGHRQMLGVGAEMLQFLRLCICYFTMNNESG